MIIENPELLALGVFAVPLLYNAYRAETFRGRFVSLSYVLIVLSVAVAASGPQIQMDSSTVEEDRLVFLNDESRSNLAERPELDFEGVSIEERTIASGNSSSIEQSLNAVVEENTTYLVNSDMQSDTEFRDAEEAFVDADSQLYFYRDDMPRESSVSITGPSTAVPNAENSFQVEVESTVEDSQRPEVTVDGEGVELEQEEESVYSFESEFSDTGTHRIEASLGDEDVYNENNRFYKSVKVIERPEILVIGEEGSLEEEAGQYFNVEHSSSVPEDLDDYYSVLLKQNIESSQELEDYLYDGNGLVYTGEGSMDILPTREHDYSQSTQNPRIIVGIDNSQAEREEIAGCTVGESIKESKELGTSLVSSLASQRPESIVGAFAYNDTVWELGEPQPLSNEKYRNSLLGTSLQGGIPSIPVCGTAYQIQALQASKNMIGDSPGNIILITDGAVPKNRGVLTPSVKQLREKYDNNIPQFELDRLDTEDITEQDYRDAVIEEASSLNENVSLHTVAVGEDPETEFLRELANSGNNGVYYDGFEEFDALENRFQGGGGSDRKGIGVVDANHFITEGLGSLSSTVTDVEDMASKPGARTLVQTSDDRDFLTTWRYGLGRVASFSGDGRNLENVMGQEPVLFMRTLNWATGDPERKNDETVKVESARMGEEVVLEASYPADGFTQVGEDSYRASTDPDSAGFHDYFGNEFAYNYREEIQSLGYREEVMDRMASATGGEVIEEESLNDLQEEVKSTEVETAETLSLSTPLLALALIIFLVQVGVRKSKGWM